MEEFIINLGPIIAAIFTGFIIVLLPFIGIERVTRGQLISKFLFVFIAVFSLIVVMSIYKKEYKPTNQWDKWSYLIKKDIKACKESSLEVSIEVLEEKIKAARSDLEKKKVKEEKRKAKKKVALCVTQSLKNNADGIPPVSGKNNTSKVFYHDIRAGDVLTSISDISDVFYDYFGIHSNTFLGSGSTVPWSHTPQYKNADAREYLVPNFHETNKLVWTWQLDRTKVDLKQVTVSALVKGESASKKRGRGRKRVKRNKMFEPTESSNQTPLKRYYKRLDRKRTSITSEPPVIRFQEFPKHFYKGTMGRPEAFRVFTVSLQDVWDMTLEDAIRASGFLWKEERNQEKTLFVWLFVPSHNDEAVPATWGNILQHATHWLDLGFEETANGKEGIR